ncbi:hypothetical protein [Labrys wisconsinensis]|uniref:L-arabinose isomerase n=1 Tax=Labrys wisconsinensis TaxID=425677 RepID=A0ABU0J8M8_9HYPH|nr:hypothetical protein [Labrys wisconsinensis]MDQ0469604.1 L-arabinose isomerase [Labrys wisconsinensis]
MARTGRPKPRIGVLALGLAAYWPQFPGMRDGLLGHYRTLLGKLGDAELVDAGFADSIEAARAASAAFAGGDVDLVVCHLTTYATSEPLLIAVHGLDVPVVLMNVQSVPALDMDGVHGIADWLGVACTCAGLPEMTAVLIRGGKRFDVITGHLDGDAEVDDGLRDWCAAASIRRTLRTRSFGLLGRPYPGMTDLHVDETAFFQRFGAYVRHLDWDDIVTQSHAVTPPERAARVETLTAAFDLPEGEALDAVASVLAGLDRLVETHRLCAIPNHYEGMVREEHAGILAASNPAFAVLMTEGVACPVEADIKTALAMLMLKHVAGSATLAELYSMDFHRDECIIGHSGAADLAVSSQRPTLQRSAVFHGKSGAGYLTQAYPKLGPVTLLSLTQGRGGAFRLVAAEGEAVAGPGLRLGDTNCRVRFSCGLRAFVNGWASFGPTHHGVLAIGRQIDRLRRVATLFDLPLEIVCR